LVFFCFRNKAIADYLASNGYTGTLSEFQKEADMVSSDIQITEMSVSIPGLDKL